MEQLKKCLKHHNDCHNNNKLGWLSKVLGSRHTSHMYVHGLEIASFLSGNIPFFLNQVSVYKYNIHISVSM